MLGEWARSSDIERLRTILIIGIIKGISNVDSHLITAERTIQYVVSFSGVPRIRRVRYIIPAIHESLANTEISANHQILSLSRRCLSRIRSRQLIVRPNKVC